MDTRTHRNELLRLRPPLGGFPSATSVCAYFPLAFIGAFFGVLHQGRISQRGSHPRRVRFDRCFFRRVLRTRMPRMTVATLGNVPRFRIDEKMTFFRALRVRVSKLLKKGTDGRSVSTVFCTGVCGV